MLKLTKRLKGIVDFTDEYDTIIDVGTDHGKVPITLANMGKAKNIIATDVNLEPLNVCKNNAKKYLLNKNFPISFIKTNGLLGIDKNLDCEVIISGMGYDLIKDILNDINEYSIKELIISPHTKPNEFVKLVPKLGFNIIDIKTIFEDDKCYFVFKCIKNKFIKCHL